jgi:hypothetical protein
MNEGNRLERDLFDDGRLVLGTTLCNVDDVD